MESTFDRTLSPSASILLVEDDVAVARVLTVLLTKAGYRVTAFATAELALVALAHGEFDLVLSDLRLPAMSGFDLLGRVVTATPELPVVLITAQGSVALAVEAMRAGASDFLLKPFERDELLFVVRKALLRGAADARPPAASLPESGIVGDSAAMDAVFTTIRKVASSTATVLVRGETGTGKERVAKALHELGCRAGKAFMRVHCAALPEALLEAELFGYEKGAFTGAVARKPGRVELAHGGTLFLDEIGDISPHVQVKLLRVLQEREFERVGGTQTLKVDVRFVAATHRDLEGMVAAGTFREDLFYRLDVVSLVVPPLRDRRDDVETLAQHFAKQFGERNGKPNARFESAAIEKLRAYAWPGNVRQLQNLVERLVVLGDADQLRDVDVARELGESIVGSHRQASAADPPSNVVYTGTDMMNEHRRDAERKAIENALARAGDNRTVAARLLGVSRRTLYNKLSEFGLA